MAVEERVLDDRQEHHVLVHELLDTVEERLALLRIGLHGLVAVQRIDVRVASIGADPAREPKVSMRVAAFPAAALTARTR
jgi:hypothetical protein